METKKKSTLAIDALVLYKTEPAIITGIDDKITIKLANKNSVKVRVKDVFPLHPGPIKAFTELKEETGEVEAACEMLYGENTTLEEFAELAYEKWTPSTAWAGYLLLKENLFLTGSLKEIQVRTKESYLEEKALKLKKNKEKADWEDFLTRIKSQTLQEDDLPRFESLKNLAFEKTAKDKILKGLRQKETSLQAYKLLIQLGIWDKNTHPYLEREGFNRSPKYSLLDPIPKEERTDLTAMQAFAIDDEGNTDPDDAISIDGDKLWVHIADPASVVYPDSPADLLAQTQGASIYLPEKTIGMLPPEAVNQFGLGIKEISPALSFGITLNADGSIEDVEIVLSWIKATRTTYKLALEQLDTSPLKEILEKTELYHKHRLANGAIDIFFPEVKIRARDSEKVEIKPIPNYKTQSLVSNAMIMAGEAAARFAIDHEIPLPYIVQPSPDTEDRPKDLAGMMALRKKMRPSSISVNPGIHGGLGISSYSRVTSPLRRHTDLLAHQQLRAYLQGRPLFTSEEILYKGSSSFDKAKKIQRAERTINLHWKLVYLNQHPDWQGDGIIVEIGKRLAVIIIPELDIETTITLKANMKLNDKVLIKIGNINLLELQASFI